MSELDTPADTALNLGTLESHIADALAEAQRLGASAAEAATSTSTGMSTTVRLGEVETIEHTRDRGLGVTVYFGQRKGSASTTDLSPGAIAETVAAACAIARYTTADECAGLADREHMAEEPPELDLRHPWPLAAEDAIALAQETEQAARDVDPRITNSEGATVGWSDSAQAYGNTHGFLASYPGTRHSVSCVVIAENEDGMQRDYWYSASRDPRALEAGPEIGRRAGERTVRRLGARQLPTCTPPVVFSAEVATGLFGHLVAAVRGSSLYRKASFLLDHLGERVFPEFVRIHEQPHLPRGIGSAPYDSEGVATRTRDLVADGVLQGYVLSSYSARKLGMETTGNAGGVHNLTVEPGPGAASHDDLLAEMGSGLLVTELMGMGVNVTTGDYSRGASGYWVEDGAIAYPVHEITIAGNLADIFLGIRGIADDVDLRGNLRTGSVLIGQMTVAGS